jgi:hypothetical protein
MKSSNPLDVYPHQIRSGEPAMIFWRISGEKAAEEPCPRSTRGFGGNEVALPDRPASIVGGTMVEAAAADGEYDLSRLPARGSRVAGDRVAVWGTRSARINGLAEACAKQDLVAVPLRREVKHIDYRAALGPCPLTGVRCWDSGSGGRRRGRLSRPRHTLGGCKLAVPLSRPLVVIGAVVKGGSAGTQFDQTRLPIWIAHAANRLAAWRRAETARIDRTLPEVRSSIRHPSL